MELNIHYRDFIGSFINFLPKRVDLICAVHKLAKLSSNPGKVHFEVLVHLLRYIRDNKTSELKYYADMKYEPLYNLLRQDNLKTENHLMAFYGSSCKYFPYTGRITGSYIIFYQCGEIDHGTHVTGTVYQSSA